jgi:hypothetical protein
VPYHLKAAIETRRRNGRDLQKIRLCANSAVAAHAAKSRNVRRNLHSLKGKNVKHIKDLFRGGESGIRTMNLAGRIHLKTQSNSAR